MRYFLKQKFDIAELVELPKSNKTALLIINEDTLSDIYRKHLQENNFQVIAVRFSDPESIADSLKLVDLLIMEMNAQETRDRLGFIKTLSENHPQIAVITIGNSLDNETLNTLMGLGAVGHLDRKFSRPQDVIQIAKTLIN